uniref:RoaA protein n=1 Tax=Strombomonas acuminata TaxID=201859 RepID=I6NJY8_9EUGL|nr:RoaA protein [Strombomonas acuminata]
MVPFFLSKKKGLSFYFELPNLYNICLQALCNLSILPFVESGSDRFSFGFKPYRYSSDVYIYIKKLFQSNRNLSFFYHHKFDLLNSLDTNVWLFKNFPFDRTIFKDLVKKDNVSFFTNYQDFYVRRFDFSNTIKNFLFDGLVRIFKSKFYFTLTFIRSHKRKLKTIVKNSFDLNIYSMIVKLNYYISQWTINHHFTDYFWDIWSEMDTYTNKLLWKWARRRHPRRPNTWIYNKYWKSFMGSWKFFSIDSITGNINFLQSHYSLETFIYRFPISLEIYDLRNYKKVKEVCFKKNKNVLKGLYSLLWYKQQGLCFSCKRPFFLFHLGCFKLCKKYEDTDNSISNILMLHNYCYF